MMVHNYILAALAAAVLPSWLAAQPVEAVEVISKKLERKYELPGEFFPYQRVDIHSKLTGFVERIEVDRGSAVKKGQLLAVVVAPELAAQRLEAQAKVLAVESQSAEAEARVVAAQSTYDRLKAASATPGVVAGNELIQAGKTVEVARAQVRAIESSRKAAQASVKVIEELETYLRVTAPFDGVIAERLVHPGALVGPGAKDGPMLTLEQTARLRLVVPVPEVDVAGIARGIRVPFTVPAYPGAVFSGVVARVSPSMDPKTRSMPVELDVENGTRKLAPGMYPSVHWPVRKAAPSLLVPPAAIVTTTERAFVIRVRDGAAEWVNVTRGRPAGDLTEVFGPLQGGDLVVRRGSDEIRNGAKLAVKAAK